MRSQAQRGAKQLRPLKLTPNWLHHADGSCLIEMGKTRVVAAASVASGVPPFLKGKGQGWLTAEYGMLPGSTSDRTQREAAKGKQSGRTVEIQRLIGRSLRQCVDMALLGENTVTVDCDVLDADGGTRTASISAGYVALYLAVRRAIKTKTILVKGFPVVSPVAAVSVGIVDGKPRLDLDYELDVKAGVDMNVVMNGEGRFIEVQGTGEHASFSRGELDTLLDFARHGILGIFDAQRLALKRAGVQ